MGNAELPKDWAGGDKEYLQFVLYKDNQETQVFYFIEPTPSLGKYARPSFKTMPLLAIPAASP